jgi:hypothetical protein
MKNTKLMLAGITTFILTWLFISVVGYLLSNGFTFRQCLIRPSIITIMLLVGWIPVIPVMQDLNIRYGL